MLPFPTQLLGTASLLVAGVAAASRPSVAWRAGAIALAAMAAMVATDAVEALHTAVDEGLRSRGLYQGHVRVQWTIMTSGAIALPLFGAAIIWRWRGAERAMLLGLLCLAALFGLEAVSLHAVDVVLSYPVGPVIMLALGWLAGAMVVVASAVADARR